MSEVWDRVPPLAWKAWGGSLRLSPFLPSVEGSAMCPLFELLCLQDCLSASAATELGFPCGYFPLLEVTSIYFNYA